MSSLLGVGMKPEDFGVLQVGLRALVIYIVAVTALRLADRRFLSRISAIDIILGIMLGTMLGRAINGSAAVGPSIAGAFVLIVLHRISAYFGYRSAGFASLVHGHAIELFAEGQMNRTAMRKTRITEDDLMQQIREHGSIERLDQAERVTLERGGQISVVKKN